MTKQELALQYFPDAVSETAVRHLMRWATSCIPLAEALAKTGYQSRNRSLTWRQVLQIRSFLGEPAEQEEPFHPSLPLDIIKEQSYSSHFCDYKYNKSPKTTLKNGINNLTINKKSS